MLEKLIIDNERLIYSIANYFKSYHSKEDLFQAGCMGLIKAYNNFDSTLDVKFTTYAYPYILGEMKKLIREDKTMKVSRDISKVNLKIEKAYVLLTQKLGKEPSTYELSEFLNIPHELIVEALNSFKISSLDDVVYDNLRVEDIVSDKVNDLDTLIALRNSIEELSEEEKEIINLRYVNDLTQMEVSKLLGISQVQVSRKEGKLLVKIKDKMIA